MYDLNEMCMFVCVCVYIINIHRRQEDIHVIIITFIYNRSLGQKNTIDDYCCNATLRILLCLAVKIFPRNQKAKHEKLEL